MTMLYNSIKRVYANQSGQGKTTGNKPAGRAGSLKPNSSRMGATKTSGGKVGSTTSGKGKKGIQSTKKK